MASIKKNEEDIVTTSIENEEEKLKRLVEENEKRVHETTTIRLFKDNGKYKDPAVVMCNGKCYQIERGINVEVPVFVAEILRNSEEQDLATSNLIERESEKAEGKLATIS